MTTDHTIAQRCGQVATAAREAVGWTLDTRNAAHFGAGTAALATRLRRAVRRAERLQKAATAPTSISVYGPSQAGKSFLVSVLARPAGGRLRVTFETATDGIDYIRQINPEGEGESTGLVTRFTMARPTCPPGFPVRLDLLTEADIARIQMNSFLLDGDLTEPVPEPEQIAAHLQAFRDKMVGDTVPGLDGDDMLDIADYARTSFGKTAHVSALKPFWEEASLIAPRLPVALRGAFLAILWGQHAALTGLYVQLAQGLARLSHARVIYAPCAALLPRDHSIIDVKMLHGLARTDSALLTVSTQGGARSDIRIPELCALVAEVTVPMQDLPSPVFGHVDLLDFPGARNRFAQPIAKTLLQNQGLAQLYLRGKVAFLFDRYVENQEITTMLLCVPDSNMETLDLPVLVDTWIANTHGADPQVRQAIPSGLFFVLTKFDKHLGESAADGGTSSRFERRIQASLLEKFGKGADGWVDAWTPGQPFRNCFWLRNPNYFAEGLILYDADHKELEIRLDKRARLAELRAGFLSAQIATRHFSNPGAAWDAAMALNDGGVTLLLAELTRVCTPDRKARQLAGQIEALAQGLAQDLRPAYRPTDIEALIAKKQEAADRAIDGLEAALERQLFGRFLAALTVTPDEIASRISRPPVGVHITTTGRAGSVARTDSEELGPTDPVRPRRGVVAPVAKPPPNGPRVLTPEEFQSETALEIWHDAMADLRGNAPFLLACGMTEAQVADLTAEMRHAFRRRQVPHRMRTALNRIGFGHTLDQRAAPAAILCAEMINRFVHKLDYDQIAADLRPKVIAADASSRPIFSWPVPQDTVASLPARQLAMAKILWTDWVHAVDEMFHANARDVGGTEIDVEQNLRIGAILRDLSWGSSA